MMGESLSSKKPNHWDFPFRKTLYTLILSSFTLSLIQRPRPAGMMTCRIGDTKALITVVALNAIAFNPELPVFDAASKPN